MIRLLLYWYNKLLLLQLGRTALHRACCRGHIEVMKHLINNNADISVTDSVSDYAVCLLYISLTFKLINQLIAIKRISVKCGSHKIKCMLKVSNEVFTKTDMTVKLHSYSCRCFQSYKFHKIISNLIVCQYQRHSQTQAYCTCMDVFPGINFFCPTISNTIFFQKIHMVHSGLNQCTSLSRPRWNLRWSV